MTLFEKVCKLIKGRPDLEREEVAAKLKITTSHLGNLLNRKGSSFRELRKKSIEDLMSQTEDGTRGL